MVFVGPILYLSENEEGGWRSVRAVWLAYSSLLSFYLGRLVAALSRPDSHGVHSPETCGINKDNAVWNNNSQFCPKEGRDNRHECSGIQKKPRWKAKTPFWLSCGNWWNIYQHVRTPTALRGNLCRFWWRWNVVCSFVCQDHRGSAVTCLSLYSYFFSLLFPSFSFSLLPIAFSECNLVWWAGGLFWVSQFLWLPPLACGAFSWSQSCRPGLEG